MALNIENIIAEIKEASILELNDLVKAIEEEFVQMIFANADSRNGLYCTIVDHHLTTGRNFAAGGQFLSLVNCFILVVTIPP